MARKCRICRDHYQPMNSLQVACSPPCAIEYQAKQKEKAKKKAEKAEKAPEYHRFNITIH